MKVSESNPIFEGPGLHKNHQNSTRRHPERDKKSKNGAGEGKTSAKFWAPPFLVPPSEPHPGVPKFKI